MKILIVSLITLDEFKPVIIDKSTSEQIKLSHLLFSPNATGRKTARMEIFRFHAPAGNYILSLTEGSSISREENRLIKKMPLEMVDHDKYFITGRCSGRRDRNVNAETGSLQQDSVRDLKERTEFPVFSTRV